MLHGGILISFPFFSFFVEYFIGGADVGADAGADVGGVLCCRRCARSLGHAELLCGRRLGDPGAQVRQEISFSLHVINVVG